MWPSCSPRSGAGWKHTSTVVFPICPWLLFPNKTTHWKLSLTMSYSCTLVNIFFKWSLKWAPFSLPACLPTVNCAGEKLGQLHLFWKWGWGGLRRKRAMQDPRQLGLLTFPLSLCVHWAVLFLFCNGFFCGKLTFWLNRSDSHWAPILSLPGVCTSLKVTSTGSEYDWGCGIYFSKEELPFTALNYFSKTASQGYAEESRYLLHCTEENLQSFLPKLLSDKTNFSDTCFRLWFAYSSFHFFNDRPNV